MTMPMDKSKYPPDWAAISRAAKERAGWICESCGVAHGALIIRSEIDQAAYVVWDSIARAWYQQGVFYQPGMLPAAYRHKPVTVVLTVHHIGVPKADGTPGDPHDKADCRDENLTALCQRCHLLADLDNHIAARRVNAARRQTERGQQNLWSES